LLHRFAWSLRFWQIVNGEQLQACCCGTLELLLPHRYRSSSEAGRSCCRSLRLLLIHRLRSTRLRVPLVLCVLLLRFTKYEQRDMNSCRTQLQPIRTFGEITAHIKIFPAHQPYLYQKLSKKATQLRLLGMTYGQIAKSLHINRKTATKACKYEGR